jgi:hypothetical protein
VTTANPMNESEREALVIGHFASACERMNEFARSLHQSSRFVSVRTGADIRNYESGWRLEKWVEAELDRAEGLWAAWWLELGRGERGWVIQSHLAISPDVLFVGLMDELATSPEEIEKLLSAAVENLKDALNQNQQFAEEVKKKNRGK